MYCRIGLSLDLMEFEHWNGNDNDMISGLVGELGSESPQNT